MSPIKKIGNAVAQKWGVITGGNQKKPPTIDEHADPENYGVGGSDCCLTGPIEGWEVSIPETGTTKLYRA